MSNLSPATPRRSSFRSVLPALAGLAFGLLCLGLVARGLDLRGVGQAFLRADPGWVGLAFVLILGTLFARTWRWQVLLEPLRVPFARAWRALLLGQMANTVLPARGGDLLRAVLLAGEGRGATASAMASVVTEKVWDLLALFLTAVGLLLLTPLPAWFTEPVGWLALGMALALLAILAVLLTRRHLLAWLRRRLARWSPGWADRAVAFLERLAEGLAALPRPAVAGRAALCTLATWTLGAAANWAVLRAFALAGWQEAVFLLAVLMAGLAVPTSPARLGVFEGLTVLALAAFRVPGDVALASGLVLHVVVLLPPALGAAAGVGLWRMGMGDRGIGKREDGSWEDGRPVPEFPTSVASSPVASVIVPACNAAATLGACLQALREQTIPWTELEVIVVDDGSTDGTAGVAEAAGARVLRIAHAGPAAARNAGARAARAPLLLFTDADCAPGPHWVEQMVQALADPGVAGVKGTYRTRQRGLVPRFVQQEYEDKYARMARQESIDFVDTYAAAYRRQVFLLNRGFDPIFPVPSVEDQEFSFRLARKGYRLVFLPQAWVWHQHDGDLWEYLRRKFGIGYWKALLVQRHPERIVRDSHTPPVLRLQIALMGLLLAGLAALPLWPPAWLAPAGAAAALLLTTVPFALRVAGRDPAVALVSPLLLAARALALGSGLLVGFLRFAFRPMPVPAATRSWPRLVKRAMDLAGAVLGLILFGPLILLLAVLVRLDSPGPALFIQDRVGQNGRVFRMVKLRTMVPGAEELPEGAEDPSPAALPIPKPQEDARVTRLGRILRRWSLDELPQLLNVLKGEMSLVGPRPEEVRVARFYADWHRRRLLVKPGLTGPMQVNGRGSLPLDRRVEMELEYIEHYSLWRDLALLARTIPAVIRGEGAR